MLLLGNSESAYEVKIFLRLLWPNMPCLRNGKRSSKETDENTF